MGKQLDITADLYGPNAYLLTTIWKPGRSIPRELTGWFLVAQASNALGVVGTYFYVPGRGVKTNVAMTAGQSLTPPPDFGPVDGLVGVTLAEADDQFPGQAELAYRYFRDAYRENPGMDVLDAWKKVTNQLKTGAGALLWLGTWGPPIALGLTGIIAVLYGASKVK